jgi:3-hydroxyacyl-[acyl-carrier-protein] dehydratase
MERTEIEALLPHRGAMLWVDRLTTVEPGVRAVGTRAIRHDEFWVAGHFPGHAVLPGVLVAEALAQVGALAWLAGHPETAGQAVYLVGIDKLRFRRPVRPGEVLELDVRVTDVRHGMLRCEGSARVGGERVADGTFLATLART